MSLSPRAAGKLGRIVGSLCKVWGVGRWCVGVGGDPKLKVFLRVRGAMGSPRGHHASVCPSPLQDYSAIIELVETLQALPTCDVAEQHNVCFHYTFALNR